MRLSVCVYVCESVSVGLFVCSSELKGNLENARHVLVSPFIRHKINESHNDTQSPQPTCHAPAILTPFSSLPKYSCLRFAVCRAKTLASLSLNTVSQFNIRADSYCLFRHRAPNPVILKLLGRFSNGKSVKINDLSLQMYLTFYGVILNYF